MNLAVALTQLQRPYEAMHAFASALGHFAGQRDDREYANGLSMLVHLVATLFDTKPAHDRCDDAVIMRNDNQFMAEILRNGRLVLMLGAVDKLITLNDSRVHFLRALIQACVRLQLITDD